MFATQKAQSSVGLRNRDLRIWRGLRRKSFAFADPCDRVGRNCRRDCYMSTGRESYESAAVRDKRENI